MPLMNLPGVKSRIETECEYITKPSQIGKIITSGKAACSAGTNGAFDIYFGDDGLIYGNLHRHLATIEKYRTNTIQEAHSWAKRWLKEIK